MIKAEDIGLKLHEPVTREHPMGPLEQSFCVEVISRRRLTVRELWPRGDAPEAPTVDDAIGCLTKSLGQPIDASTRVFVNGKEVPRD